MSGRKICYKSMFINQASFEERETQTDIIQKPEKAKNAYLWFCQDMMKNLKECYPESNQTERFSIQADYWKSLNEKERQDWINQAEKDKERYEREILIYKSIN